MFLVFKSNTVIILHNFSKSYSYESIRYFLIPSTKNIILTQIRVTYLIPRKLVDFGNIYLFKDWH